MIYITDFLVKIDHNFIRFSVIDTSLYLYTLQQSCLKWSFHKLEADYAISQ